MDRDRAISWRVVLGEIRNEAAGIENLLKLPNPPGEPDEKTEEAIKESLDLIRANMDRAQDLIEGGW